MGPPGTPAPRSSEESNDKQQHKQIWTIRSSTEILGATTINESTAFFMEGSLFVDDFDEHKQTCDGVRSVILYIQHFLMHLIIDTLKVSLLSR